jgi:hypothetical protein
MIEGSEGVFIGGFSSSYSVPAPDDDLVTAADKNKNCGSVDCGNCKKGCGAQPK